MTAADDGVPIRRGALRGARAAHFGGADLEALLDDPDGFIGRAANCTAVLKDDGSARLVRCALDGHDVVIKRHRYPDAWRALRRGLRPSRARRGWRASALLTAAGLAVPAPLAWLERRHGPVCTGSWEIMAFVAGREAPDALADPGLDAAGRARLVAVLAATVLRLQTMGIVHGDLKATNLLVTPDARVLLLDVHAARRVAPGGRALARDRERFLRNWYPDPALDRAFRTRFGQR